MSVSVKHITVTFPGIVALKDISLTFEPGRVHAILGANGSGKSTLVKVMTGVYQPDAGKGAQIVVDENCVERMESPSVSKEMGISVVHQEAPLIDVLSVAESVALFKGYPKKRGGRSIDWKALYRYTEELFSLYKLAIDPHTMVNHLTAAERGMVAMAIALGSSSDLAKTKALILDEADASIPEAEAEKFLEHVKHVATLGIPVIMVTHRLKEVRSICDDVTILNDGNVVYSGLMKEADDDFIISKMLRQDQTLSGDSTEDDISALRELWKLCGRGNTKDKTSGAALSVRALKGPHLNGLDFSVQRGEVIGFVGIPDSGVSELSMVLGGDLQRSAGEIEVYGEKVPVKLTPRAAIRAGIMLQPTDRFRQGGILSGTLRENMLLPNEAHFWHKKKLEKRVMEKAIHEFDIRPRMADMPFGKFSGGNQQKAIIGKWLQLRPSVLIMDDPTYGVDPAARQKIFASIQAAAACGVAIIVFSTEPEQLSYICSRVLVLRGGQVVCELSQAQNTLSREAIARWCYA